MSLPFLKKGGIVTALVITVAGTLLYTGVRHKQQIALFMLQHWYDARNGKTFTIGLNICELPPQWSIANRDNDTIELIRIPSTTGSKPLYLFIRRGDFNSMLFKELPVSTGTSLYQTDQVHVRLNGADYIEYIYSNNRYPNRGTYEFVWSDEQSHIYLTSGISWLTAKNYYYEVLGCIETASRSP